MCEKTDQFGYVPGRGDALRREVAEVRGLPAELEKATQAFETAVRTNDWSEAAAAAGRMADALRIRIRNIQGGPEAAAKRLEAQAAAEDAEDARQAFLSSRPFAAGLAGFKPAAAPAAKPAQAVPGPRRRQAA